MWEKRYAFIVLSEYSIIFQKKNENTSQFPKKKKKNFFARWALAKVVTSKLAKLEEKEPEVIGS